MLFNIIHCFCMEVILSINQNCYVGYISYHDKRDLQSFVMRIIIVGCMLQVFKQCVNIVSTKTMSYKPRHSRLKCSSTAVRGALLAGCVSTSYGNVSVKLARKDTKVKTILQMHRINATKLRTSSVTVKCHSLAVSCHPAESRIYSVFASFRVGETIWQSR